MLILPWAVDDEPPNKKRQHPVSTRKRPPVLCHYSEQVGAEAPTC